MKKSLMFVVTLLAVLALLVSCAPASTPTQAAEPTKAAEQPAVEPTKAPEQPAADTKYTLATVVKLTGVGWFDRMETGVKKFNEEHANVEAFQQGPAKADAALQVQVIEDLIAQKVNAICVVPFQPDSLEPVLKKAMDQGIVVISHEASNQQNVDFDIEAFDNAEYGRHFMDQLGEMMGGEGEYVVMVGSLTSKTHNEWVDAAIEYQKEKYPNMKLVGDKNESYDDAQKAYEKAKEILKAYPNLKGMQGSSANDVVGFGMAVEEMGLQDKIAVVGTSMPSMAGKYLETGAVDSIGFWDPAIAGEAMNALALMILEGKVPTDGMDLGLKGYENITLKGKVFYGNAWIDVTKDNVKDYDF